MKASRVAVLIATWFGCGCAPVAPGTVGSAAAILIAALLVRGLGWRPWHLFVLAAATLPAAVWASTVAARARNEKDPGTVVVDEVLGQWLTLAAAPELNWKSYLGGFLLFRLFDVWKPPPVRRLEALPGGLGIVADDVAAGLYAALVLSIAGCFNLY